MRNRAEGPRRAQVNVGNLGDNVGHVFLEEHEESLVTAQTRLVRPAMKQAGFSRSRRTTSPDSPSAFRELREMALSFSAQNIDALARQWWQRHPNDPRLRLGKAIVADSVASLEHMLDRGLVELQKPDRTRDYGHWSPRSQSRWRLFIRAWATNSPGWAVLFRPSGRMCSMRPGRGKRLSARAARPARLVAGRAATAFADHRVPILGSVSVGALVTDVLRRSGRAPDAAIGYSLGESAALVALRAWTDRDEMLRRLRSSPLFKTELAGPCDAARRLWEIPASEPVDWVAGIVPRSAEAVRSAIGEQAAVYMLIRNTAEETVIGGQRSAVEAVVKALECPFVELPTVSTVHCEIGRTVEPNTTRFTISTTTAPQGIDFYSGAWGRPYPVDRQSAADAITAQAIQTIDFPALIERAYARRHSACFWKSVPGSRAPG